MEQVSGEQIPEKEESLPEKPLELDKESGIRKKKYGFKNWKDHSIFGMKSILQNNGSEAGTSTNLKSSSSKQGVGQGDTIERTKIPAVFLPQNPTIRVESPEKVAETAKIEKQSISENKPIYKHENVKVDVHNPRTPEGPQQTISAKSSEKISPPTHHSYDEGEKTLTFHDSPYEKRSRHRGMSSQQHLTQTSRRIIKRNAGASSSTRKSSQADSSSAMDQKTLKRKYKHLLSLVEELTEHCDYYKNALRQKESNQDAEKIRQRKETEALNMQIFKLGQEVEAWKEECQKMESKSTALMKVKNLTQENGDLHADIEVHKSVIIRLNKELAFYQDKLRVKYKDTPENIPTYSSSGETDADSNYPEDDWLQYPRQSLLPLLIAYDEVIAEKEELIKDHERTLDRFKGKCMEIVEENETLHQLISNNKEKGSISLEEWEFLRSNAVIVLEENDLLHEQINNLKRKEEKLFATFQVKAAEFKQTITQHESEIRRQRATIDDLERRCKELSEEHASMAANVHSRIPREKHEAMVQDFKKAFDELKSKYESDKKVLSDKIMAAEKEREGLVEDVANLDNENTHLRREIQDYEKNLAATSEALEQMKASLLETTSAREATNGVIDDFVKHIQQLAAEKNKLIEDLNQQRLLNEQMMTLRSKENDLVKQLHDKIEAMERLHNDEVKSVQSKVKELEEALKTKSERHRRESLQLHELLEEKERRLEAMDESKRQLQQDLETVWKTTTSMNSLKNRNV